MENKGQSGVYRWVNKLNFNTYVGSGVDLSKRIKIYYNHSELKRNPRPIHAALLKYGHDSFKLEILEYCRAVLRRAYKKRTVLFGSTNSEV